MESKLTVAETDDGVYKTLLYPQITPLKYINRTRDSLRLIC